MVLKLKVFFRTETRSFFFADFITGISANNNKLLAQIQVAGIIYKHGKTIFQKKHRHFLQTANNNHIRCYDNDVFGVGFSDPGTSEKQIFSPFFPNRDT